MLSPADCAQGACGGRGAAAAAGEDAQADISVLCASDSSNGIVQVAILCNHQRSVPKGHAGAMEKLQEKMHKLNEELLELQHELKAAKQGKPYKEKKLASPEV